MVYWVYEVMDMILEKTSRFSIKNFRSLTEEQQRGDYSAA